MSKPSRPDTDDAMLAIILTLVAFFAILLMGWFLPCADIDAQDDFTVTNIEVEP